MLFTFVLTLVFVLLLSKSIKKHSYVYYTISTLLVLATIILNIMKMKNGYKLDGFALDIENCIKRGVLPTAFFILVMYVGALNSKWKITKRLLNIRAELAIIASILMMSHCVLYLKGFIMHIGPIIKNSNTFPTKYFLLSIIGIIGFIIMLPLFITSIKKVRCKMDSTKWKQLQRWSYLYYFLIYAHVFIILVGRKSIDYVNLGTYTVLFGVYTIMRILKYNKKRKNILATEK
ncbi:ferric reductase-like transmembrane domain-containing protein [Clostridiaceae bacterium M8S5]|nr:ferric reductase-like transmembrane domain-containing protein [Clostridiaceae bacterium M8S5]